MTSKSVWRITELRAYYAYIDEPSDRYKCVLCGHVLSNAKQTSCGCRVCEKCINTYLKEGEKQCPSKQPDCAETKLMLNRDIHQDNAINREILNLKAKCTIGSCTVIDSLRMIVIHVDTCGYREMTCGECGSKYSWKDKDKHAKEECNRRIVKCPHCHKEMTALRQQKEHLNEDHEDLCSKYVADCNNGCGAMNVNLKDHLKNCPNKKVDCPFAPLQCKVGRLTKANLETHLRLELIPHFQTLVEELEILKKVKKTLEVDVQNLQSLLKEQIGIIKKLTENQQKLEKTIENIKKKGIGGATSERNVVFRKASFIWKITNFENLKNNAETGMMTSITSDSFCVRAFGYKMCLRIYPYGDEVGRSTHLSVAVVIVEGEYDEEVSSSFKRMVTLSLLDQANNGANKHSLFLDIDSSDTNNGFENIEVTYECSRFIQLANLCPNSIYYTNDSLYLQVSIGNE